MSIEAGSQPSVPPPSSVTREFSMGAALSSSFSVWWNHVLLFSLLTVVADLPIFAVSLIGGVPIPGMTAPARNPFELGATPSFPWYFWLGYLVTVLLVMVEVGAITHTVISYLGGKRASLDGMLTTGLRRFFPLVGVSFVTSFMLLFGFILLIVPGIILACALAVITPVTVAERRGVFGAIGRSFFLTKGHRFAILLVIVILFLVFLSVTVFSRFMLPALTASFAPMFGTLLGLALNILVGSLVWIAPAVIYHDLRMAKEGLDAQQLAAVFD